MSLLVLKCSSLTYIIKKVHMFVPNSSSVRLLHVFDIICPYLSVSTHKAKLN